MRNLRVTIRHFVEDYIAMQGLQCLLTIVANLLYSCRALPVFQAAENLDRITAIAQKNDVDIHSRGHQAVVLPIRELEEQDNEEGKSGFIGDITGIPTLPFINFKRELEDQDVKKTKDGFIGDTPPFKRERGGEQDKEMRNGFIGDLTGINSLPFKRDIERVQIAKADPGYIWLAKRDTDSMGLEDGGDYWTPFISDE
ncbi:hypothetical protein CVT26_005290 [Gymnopilus dilepis]|uniref:Uncharacterized protein n=1 Tax=Gymnopilus dilepis TaxID=231916 RepID=A0A409YSU9_9AGAR|nr:hypothetical protein CVT26_005290 [Gymnopilus dilepis]